MFCQVVETIYMSTLKQLLIVRPTTWNDIAMVDAGVENAKSYIANWQNRFIHQLVAYDWFENIYIYRQRFHYVNRSMMPCRSQSCINCRTGTQTMIMMPHDTIHPSF